MATEDLRCCLFGEAASLGAPGCEGSDGLIKVVCEEGFVQAWREFCGQGGSLAEAGHGGARGPLGSGPSDTFPEGLREIYVRTILGSMHQETGRLLARLMRRFT